MKRLLITLVGPFAFAIYGVARSSPYDSWLSEVALNAAFIAIPHILTLAIASWLKSCRVAVLGVLGPNLAIVLFSVWSAHSYWGNGLEWMFYFPVAIPLALVGIVAGLVLDKRARRRELLSHYEKNA